MAYLALAWMTYRSTTTSASPLRAVRDVGMSRSATVKTPQHALRRKYPHIWIPPTPFSAYKDENHYPTVHIVWSNFGQQYTDTTQGWINYPVSDPSIMLKMRDLAVTRALENLKKQEVNCSQAIAEAGMTARLVASTATRLANTIRSIKKGDVKGVQRALGLAKPPRRRAQKLLLRIKGVNKNKGKTAELVANTWLELQYGWKPLLADVQGVAEALARADIEDPTRYRYTVRGRSKDRTDGNVAMVSGIKTQYTRRKIEHSVQVNLTYYSTNVNTALASNIGLTNPLLLAWELLPFSFVADWFIPIGSYLACLDATLGYTFMGGSYTNRWECHLTHYRTVQAGYADRWVAFNPAYSQGDNYYCHGGSAHSKSVNRFVYGSSPLPRFPGLKNPLSLTHAANAIALLKATVGSVR